MNMKALIMLFFLVALGLAVTPDGFAAIYKYIDKNKIDCFADDLHAVPEQYRATITEVGAVPEEEPKTHMRDQPQSQREVKPETSVSFTVQAKEPIDVDTSNVFSGRVMVSGMIVAGALVVFMILRTLDRDQNKLFAIARIAVAGGLAAYLIYTYAEDTVQMVKSIGTGVSAVQQKAEERGHKAAEAMKKMHALKKELENAVPPDPGEPGLEKQKLSNTQTVEDRMRILTICMIMFLAFLTIIGTFISDLLLVWIDPRIRLERGI